MQRIVSLRDAAIAAGYHPQHWRKLVRQGKLPAPFHLTEGGRPFYTEEQLDQIVAECIARRDAQGGGQIRCGPRLRPGTSSDEDPADDGLQKATPSQCPSSKNASKLSWQLEAPLKAT